MLAITYDEHCAYKPFELGIQIGQHLTNKIIPPAFKFLFYEDCVVKDGGAIDDSKHTCMLVCLDDAEGSEVGLKNMNDIASMLVGSDKIRSECGEKEGVCRLFDDEAKKYKWTGEGADGRVRFMLLDYALFKKHMEDASKTMSNPDLFAWDETQKCYFEIVNINENGIEQFKELGLNYLDAFKEENFQRVGMFCRKHWPDSWQEMKVTSNVLDMQRRFYDEEDKVWRKVWKYVFRVTKKDGTEIDGDYAVRRIGLPKADTVTLKDCAKILQYHKDAGQLRDDDMVVVISASSRGMLYLKSETGLDPAISEKFGKARLKDVIESLDEDAVLEEASFVEDVDEFIESHKQEVFGKVSHLKFEPETIFKTPGTAA